MNGDDDDDDDDDNIDVNILCGIFRTDCCHYYDGNAIINHFLIMILCIGRLLCLFCLPFPFFLVFILYFAICTVLQPFIICQSEMCMAKRYFHLFILFVFCLMCIGCRHIYCQNNSRSIAEALILIEFVKYYGNRIWLEVLS